MSAGAAVFIAIILLTIVVLQRDQGTVREFAAKATKLDLVTGMRASLAAASEAEKSALLAARDEDSKSYADASRAATSEVEQKRVELAGLLKKGGSAEETDLLEQFSKAFAAFRKLDEDLLALAVKNSNVKATRLAFGPATEAVEEMAGALSRLVEKSAGWSDASTVARLALGAENAALRIEVLLAPHIAEATDSKMDELEAAMAKQDEAVRAALAELSRLASLRDDGDLARASSSYARFAEIRAEILKLSRENTNVQSTAMSLGDKRRIVKLCEGSLAALEQAILAEAPTGTDYGRFGRPVKVR